MNTNQSLTAGGGRALTKPKKLNMSERALLAVCEKRVAAAFESMMDGGEALITIRDEELYREKYDTFEDYCLKEWGKTARRARQLMAAVQTVHVLKAPDANGQAPETLPTNERQTRPLQGLVDEDKRKVWKRAVETAPDRKPTEKDVERAAVEEGVKQKRTKETKPKWPVPNAVGVYSNDGASVYVFGSADLVTASVGVLQVGPTEWVSDYSFVVSKFSNRLLVLQAPPTYPNPATALKAAAGALRKHAVRAEQNWALNKTDRAGAGKAAKWAASLVNEARWDAREGTEPAEPQAIPVIVPVKVVDLAEEPRAAAPERCEHEFIDSNSCVKCGWAPASPITPATHTVLDRPGILPEELERVTAGLTKQEKICAVTNQVLAWLFELEEIIGTPSSMVAAHVSVMLDHAQRLRAQVRREQGMIDARKKGGRLAK